eukprot:SAG11_NODE_3458_length_2436_cov_1.462559_2_plen_60_part_00
MGAAAAAETAEQCAASGEPLIPPAWIDATHGAAEVVALARQLMEAKGPLVVAGTMGSKL